MKVYSDYPARRSAQIVADIVALALMAASVWAAVLVHDAIVVLADLGRQLEQAGSGFRDTMTDAGDSLGKVPLIGDDIRGPFDSASDAGGTLADAGVAQQSFVATAAVVVAVLVAVIPIAAVLWIWLRRRIRFAVRATAAAAIARLEDGADVLALRALGWATAKELREVSARPADAWRAGEARAIRALADLELREAGVRMR